MDDTSRDAGSKGMEAAGGHDLELLRKQVEDLRRENESLKRQGVGASAPRQSGWRKALAIIAIVLACSLAAVAVPAVWLNRTVMDTDRWVETVGPLASNAAIQDATADYASDEIFAQVDVEKLARENLPPRARFLAAPIAAQVENFVRDQAHNVVRSPQFQKLWIEANRTGHDAVIGVLTGREGKVVTTTGGKVTLDLSGLVEEVKVRLDKAGLGFVNNLPLGKLSGQYTLFESPALGEASSALAMMNSFALALPLATLALATVGIALAPDRRRATVWLGAGLVIAMLLPLVAVNLARSPYVAAVGRLGTIPDAAALAVYDTVLAGLLAALRTVLVLGLVVAAGAAAAGPSRFAVSLRSGVQGGLQGLGAGWDFGAFGARVHDHKSALRGAGIVAGVLVLFAWSSPGMAGVLWVAAGTIVWVVLVEFFGREPSTAAAAETATIEQGKETKPLSRSKQPKELRGLSEPERPKKRSSAG